MVLLHEQKPELSWFPYNNCSVYNRKHREGNGMKVVEIVVSHHSCFKPEYVH